MIGDTAATAAKDGRARRRREKNTLLAATLTNGPNELIDFILPLWAGATIGLSATEVGVLLAVEMAISVLMRPVAGVLADTYERRTIAAVGAALYAVSTAGYAFAENATHAYAAAAIGGAGGALLWVAVRAIISERLAEDSAVFPRLLAAQETGSWVAFVGGMTLIGSIDFRGVFLGCAAACAAASVLLLTSPGRPGASRRRKDRHEDHLTKRERPTAGLGELGRKLRPMLIAVAFTMTAESTISLLLVMHLQRGFGLDVTAVAFVFLPGAIVMSLASERLHGVVVRFGRTRVLTVASLFSAVFAASLAWAPHPAVIAGLWVLSGLAWATVMPIQQAVIAEASGERAGRGMGVYESASLLGALIGSLGAGLLYDHANWTAACLVAAAVILAGAVVVPRAVRRLGVADLPPPPPAPAETPVEARAAAAKDAGQGMTPAPSLKKEKREGGERRGSKPKGEAPVKTPAERAAELRKHVGTFVAAQIGLAVFGISWIADLFTEDFATTLMQGGGRDGGMESLAYGAGRIWVVVLLVDLIWTGSQLLRARSAARAADRTGGGPPR
ncbi:MFS transporter [Streptomyces sp. NPDC057638]|uniref:MFS transporter n=1 Tax=Streptomyces sp. NPDC057638 TaxID=3346190 RepID=UPI00367D8D68